MQKPTMSDSAPLVKSKDRVRDVGEVFTPDFLVEQMLNQFPDETWHKNKNWLEPTCGNGQFILGILRRKLAYGSKLLEALDTTFGCDIMHDNVSECHMRIYRDIVMPHTKNKRAKGWKDFRWMVVCIVETNIRHTKDSLQEDFSKWKRFTGLSKTTQDKAREKVDRIFSMIDGDIPLSLETPQDKRLYKELSFLSRKNDDHVSR